MGRCQNTDESPRVFTAQKLARYGRAVLLPRLGELAVDLTQHGSCEWPLHTCGTVSSITRSKPIAKSWNYTVVFPLN